MNKRIVILGAGISGLAAAWFLKQKYGSHLNLTILEQSARCGGWIQTLQQDGFLFERGPRSLRSKSIGLGTWQLIKDLNLQDQIIPSHADASARFIYYQKKLQPVPSSLWKLPFSPLTKSWWKILGREYFLRNAPMHEETIDEFFSRRFSPEWAERLIDPLVTGIFAGNIQKLSMKSCFPFFYALEQEYGGIIKGLLLNRKPSKSLQSFVRAPFFSFRRGLETLPQTLANQLQSHIQLNSAVSKITKNAETLQIEIQNGVSLEADCLISTLPSYQLASLLDAKYPILAADLSRLNYATVHVVNLGYRKPVLKQKGFGYLVPSQENEAVLGCVWDSCVFPQQNLDPQMTRLTVMLGGTKHSQMAAQTKEQVLSTALSALERQLGLSQLPDFTSIYVANRAIPQYEIGYEGWLQKVKKQFSEIHPRLICLGTAFNGVSVSDCINKAYETANFYKQTGL